LRVAFSQRPTIALVSPIPKKTDRFDMTFRIVSHSLEAVASDGMTQIVTFDYQKGKKADIPAIFRQAIETVEKGAMEHGTHH
jgi:acyl-CoA thioesterase FadM